MPTKKPPIPKAVDNTDQLLAVLQDMFILQALQAGMKGEDIRTTLRVDQWRVTNISKSLKKSSPTPKKRNAP